MGRAILSWHPYVSHKRDDDGKLKVQLWDLDREVVVSPDDYNFDLVEYARESLNLAIRHFYVERNVEFEVTTLSSGRQILVRKPE